MERIKHVIFQIILLIAIFPLYFIEFSREKHKIIESLKTLSPLFLELTLILFILLFVFCFKDLISPFKSLTKKNWIIFSLVLVFSFLLVFFVAPRTHRIYYDENIYLHIGQSIAYTNKAQMVNFGEIKYGELIVNQGEYNKQPNAYPVLLSVFYRIFGLSENLSFLVNNIFYILSTFVIFSIGFLLFKSFKIGIYAGLIYSVLPQNILWHNTTSVEPTNTFFISFTILIFIIYLQTKSFPILLLTGLSACFASQFRMESILIFPLIFLILLIKDTRYLKEPKLYYIIPLVLILMLPHAIHIYCYHSHPWGASQAKYSLSYIDNNLKTNGLFFFKNKDHPLILTIFFIFGLISTSLFRERMEILIWFLFFWGVFLFFYAGSYYYGADIRFVLMAYPAFSILAGAGLSSLDDILGNIVRRKDVIALTFIFIAFISFLPKARTVGQEAWAARADHKYAKIMAKYLPEDSIVFTHNPNMFLFWGKSSAQASILAGYDHVGLKNLKGRFPGGIYFHFNFWCNVSDPLQRSFCNNILKKFSHKEILRFKEREYSYVLYKIE